MFSRKYLESKMLEGNEKVTTILEGIRRWAYDHDCKFISLGTRKKPGPGCKVFLEGLAKSGGEYGVISNIRFIHQDDDLAGKKK